MLPTTRDAIKSILRTDPTLGSDECKEILRALRESHDKGKPPKVGPRILRRREVAAKLGCSIRTIDNLAAEGTLARVALPGRSRGIGFRLRDVEALIDGGLGR